MKQLRSLNIALVTLGDAVTMVSFSGLNSPSKQQRNAYLLRRACDTGCCALLLQLLLNLSARLRQQLWLATQRLVLRLLFTMAQGIRHEDLWTRGDGKRWKRKGGSTTRKLNIHVWFNLQENGYL